MSNVILKNVKKMYDNSKTVINDVVNKFSSDLIRFYYGSDLIGTEIGAAAKNVMGIVAGVLDGCGYASLKGSLMSRGAWEVAKLIKAMGGNELSAYGLAHLGDYEATLFSEYSHNRKYGEMLVQGAKFAKLAEGVPTAAAMKKLGEEYGVELPITNAVYELCYQETDESRGSISDSKSMLLIGKPPMRCMYCTKLYGQYKKHPCRKILN